MKIGDALGGVSRLFLDTATVIYFVERHPQYSQLVDYTFGQIDNGAVTGVTSPITLAECLVIPYRHGLVTAQRDFADLIVNGQGILFVLTDNMIAERAAELRARHNLPLADALQVSTALASNCEALLTNDSRFRRVNDLPILLLTDLEV